MTDELELLKKDWQNKEEHLPKLSYAEIHKMIWEKSSSIVKWILIISIIEFLLPHIFYLIPMSESSTEITRNLGIETIYSVLVAINYIVVIYFIYRFYSHYRKISALDNAKNLMSKIISTRKTVKHYVVYSLSMLFASCFMFIFALYLDDNIFETFDVGPGSVEVSAEKFKSAALWTVSIACTVLIAVIGLVYFLIYGRFLRKLKKNHNELKKLEI